MALTDWYSISFGIVKNIFFLDTSTRRLGNTSLQYLQMQRKESNDVIKRALVFIRSNPRKIFVFLPPRYQTDTLRQVNIIPGNSQLSVGQLTDNEICDTALELDIPKRNAIFHLAIQFLSSRDKTVSS